MQATSSVSSWRKIGRLDAPRTTPNERFTAGEHRAREQQVGNVGASDEQPKRSRKQQQQERSNIGADIR